MGSTLKGTISIMMNKLVFLILKIQSQNFFIKVVCIRPDHLPFYHLSLNHLIIYVTLKFHSRLKILNLADTTQQRIMVLIENQLIEIFVFCTFLFMYLYWYFVLFTWMCSETLSITVVIHKSLKRVVSR